MAPRGQLTYNEEQLPKNVRLLCDEVANKARCSRQAMWDVVRLAREACRSGNNGAPQHVDPQKWPLPSSQELGPPTTGPFYMPQNAKGKLGAGLPNATTESNVKKMRAVERGRN